METILLEIHNGKKIDTFEISKESGAETGDLVYDSNQEKFYPIYMLGNTNICFEKEFQAKIFKVLFSNRKQDSVRFKNSNWTNRINKKIIKL